MKNDTDILIAQLNKIVKDAIFIGNWDKARKLAKKHEETKLKMTCEEKQKKKNY